MADVLMYHPKYGERWHAPGYANSSHAARKGWKPVDGSGLKTASAATGPVTAKPETSFIEMDTPAVEKLKADLVAITKERDELRTQLETREFQTSDALEDYTPVATGLEAKIESPVAPAATTAAPAKKKGGRPVKKK